MDEWGGAANRRGAGVGSGITGHPPRAECIAAWQNEMREQAMADDGEAHGG
jgi:hypothetical protein